MLIITTSANGPYADNKPTSFQCPQCMGRISFFVYTSSYCEICDLPFAKLEPLLKNKQVAKIAYYKDGEL